MVVQDSSWNEQVNSSSSLVGPAQAPVGPTHSRTDLYGVQCMVCPTAFVWRGLFQVGVIYSSVGIHVHIYGSKSCWSSDASAMDYVSLESI